MSGSPATSDVMPFVFAASRADRVVEGERPVEQPPVIWPRSAILQSAAASSVAGIFEFTVSTAARIATFGRSTPSDTREIDRVLADVDLVLERRRDVDRRVGDDQHLVVGRHVHDEDVADAAARAQPGLARDDRAEQLVGVQAALHQQLRLALRAPARRPAAADGVAVRSIDDPTRAEVDPSRLSAISRIFVVGPTRIGVMSPFSPASDRAGQRRLFARVRHRGRNGLEARAPREQQLVLPTACLVCS